MVTSAPQPDRAGGAGPPTVSRRQFLRRSASVGSGAALGSTLAKLTTLSGVAALPAAASGLLAACSSSEPIVAPTVVPLFSPDRILAAGLEQRIPLGVVTPSAGDAGFDEGRVALPADDSPIDVAILLDGEEIDRSTVIGRIVTHDHVGKTDPDHQHANLFRYYPLRATLPRAGIYDLEITVTDELTEETAVAMMPVQIFDPVDVTAPLPGAPFPVVDTPTVQDPGEIDRLCTRFELCPFHTRSATDVLAEGRPMALLVATPAFCSTAYCGPVLDTLIEAGRGFPEIEFVHVEVYANTDEVEGNYQDPRIRLAPAVEALGLTFEPALFLVDSAGMLVDRIDNVFDGTELVEALAGL
ncbi:MAG: hypothetical protein AAF531_08810 [Actinomycetota bacterium]